MKLPRRCVGGFPGPCNNRAGTPWTDFWCPSCDEKRRQRINENLQALREQFERRCVAARGDAIRSQK